MALPLDNIGNAPVPRRGRTASLVRTILLALAVFVGTPIVALTAPGCAHVAETRAEKDIDDLLPTYLGPADRYVTRVRGDSIGAIMRGRLRSVHVEGEEIRFPQGLTLSHLAFDFEEISVDPKARQLKSVGSARFTARIGEADLNRYVTARRPDLPGLNVTLDKDKAAITLRPALLARFGITGLSIPIDVEGRLVPTNGGTQLDFTPNAASIFTLPIPRLVVDAVARSLNPAVDLSSLPIPIVVQTADIHPDGVTLVGTITPDGLVRAAGAGKTGMVAR